MGDFCGIPENLRRASQTRIVDPLHNSGRVSTIVEAESKGLSEKKGGEEHFEGSWPRGAKILWLFIVAPPSGRFAVPLSNKRTFIPQLQLTS